MESAVDEGKVRQLGISNFYSLEDVQWAYDHARIKPKVVQNRFYLKSGHDVGIRAFCKENDIEYQS
jgi:diketogulonate reductase-like aldo/keto reductase